MSDSTTEAAATAAAASVQADADAAAAATLAADPAASGEAGGATPTAEETAATEPEAAKKPTRADRHVANLTRKAADEARRAEAAERRADAAEALLAAGKTDEPAKLPPVPAADVQAEARRLNAQDRFNARLGEIDAAGKKELGADHWESAKATLTGLGAVNNTAFLQALAETEHPAQIFAAMADDTDALMDILSKPPAAMAARLGRLDASYAKPVAKPVSNAPKPAAKVDGGGTQPAANIYDKNLPDKEFYAEIDKMLPPHLGGKRKVA